MDYDLDGGLDPPRAVDGIASRVPPPPLLATYMTKRCFVIMPFSGSQESGRNDTYWTDFYDDFLRQTIEELGYECERSRASARSIVETIVSNLFQSDIVLAVLTDHNPNVFYELGVRHSLAHGTIMVIEKGQTIPSDLKAFGVIDYDRNKRAEFKRELNVILDDVQKRSHPDSPVGAFLKANDVGLARISANVSSSPLDTAGCLSVAKHDVMIVGQNLYGIANDPAKERIFAALERKPRLRVRILFADSRCKSQLEALSQIIDEAMQAQFTEIDQSFQTWIREWNRSYPSEPGRLEIKRCKRVGNVSATLVDTKYPDGLILIRPVLYHTQPNARPCHWLGRNDSPRVFESYQSAFEQIWSHGESLV